MALLVEYSSYAIAIVKADAKAKEDKCEYVVIRTPGGEFHSDFQVLKKGEEGSNTILYISYEGIRPSPPNGYQDPMTNAESFEKFKRDYGFSKKK